jgi:hypothetical protein
MAQERTTIPLLPLCVLAIAIFLSASAPRADAEPSLQVLKGEQTTLVFEESANGFMGFADTSIYSDEPDNAGGGFSGIVTGTTRFGMLRRALLKVDLSSIAPGTTVISATLELTVERSADNFGDIDHALYRLKMDWGEGTAENASAGGFGAAASPGDATWISSAHGQVQWENEGGDFESAVSATAPVGRADEVALWSSAAMAGDVQHWVNNPIENFGWIIVSATEGENQRAKRLHSSEASTNRPRLTVVVETHEQSVADIDGNNSVDAVDVQLVINAALGIDISPFEGDVSGDGSTNAVDVQLVINAVLGV